MMDKLWRCWAFMSCEKLIFDKFKNRSIKKRARKAALHDVQEYLNGGTGTQKGSVIEGDGSAWDTCCNEKLRDCIEILCSVSSLIGYSNITFAQQSGI